jgi:hypothetical protein
MSFIPDKPVSQIAMKLVLKVGLKLAESHIRRLLP